MVVIDEHLHACVLAMLLWGSAHSQEEEAQEAVQRMMSAKFDFNDFLKQWQMMNNMGGAKLLKMLPGMAQVGGWGAGEGVGRDTREQCE
jgi:signal recognition particle GTPase